MYIESFTYYVYMHIYIYYKCILFLYDTYPYVYIYIYIWIYGKVRWSRAQPAQEAGRQAEAQREAAAEESLGSIGIQVIALLTLAVLGIVMADTFPNQNY